MKTTEFNARTSRARISASWPHDQSHYRFERQHKSCAPFSEPISANLAAEVLVGVLAVLGLVFVLALVGGWI